jgi:hypothetical protein
MVADDTASLRQSNKNKAERRFPVRRQNPIDPLSRFVALSRPDVEFSSQSGKIIT